MNRIEPNSEKANLAFTSVFEAKFRAKLGISFSFSPKKVNDTARLNLHSPAFLPKKQTRTIERIPLSNLPLFRPATVSMKEPVPLNFLKGLC